MVNGGILLRNAVSSLFGPRIPPLSDPLQQVDRLTAKLMKRKHLLLGIIIVSMIGLHVQEAYSQVATPKNGPFNVALYQGAQWRNIGPYRGGRSVTATGVPGKPLLYYMGTTGGVWKTEDAGLSWDNISDGFFQVSSIGAISVAPSDPNVIYVGTGEHPVRGVMTSPGDGMYKSLDGGKTWEYIGLENSRHIAEIRIHPQHPEIAYVAVQGAVHGPSEDRGIYRTIDGGQSWEHLFFVNETTGAADLSMDPENPRILYAGMWDHHRSPWQVRSGGAGSGIYRSTDGGANWLKLTQGLPERMGKTAVAVSPVDPELIYALIEADNGGVFRSQDGGTTWNQVTSDRVTIARAWYYTEIIPDPQQEDIVYVLNAPLLRSTDGGRSFNRIANPHSDQHDLWINPDNPKNMILANDGGACITFNGGQAWSSQSNQPTAQFYRVIADNRFPYYVYGGQQDNSTMAIPSRTTAQGITARDWYPVAGGESAFIAFDPDDPQLVYGGSYQGNISVYDHETGATKDIMAYPSVGLATLPREMKFRFNWNAPIVASPQDPRIIYHAAQSVLRTRDGGISWQVISPDLTRNEVEKQGLGGAPFTNEGAGGENYNTISYLACSPHDPWVIWVGSDDGLIHLTRDEGQSWINVTPPDLEECLINSIEVSPHDPATAYVVATRYKFNDLRPFIYKTTDFGENWTKVTRGIPPEDFVRVVREDPLRPGLLYAGTETGLYLSYNEGSFWHRFQLNLPVCPITDLTIQDNDLIAATSGRGFWILDDVGCIQQTAGYLLARTPQVFQPKPCIRIESGTTPATAAIGSNPIPGMIIDYYLPPQLDSAEVRLQVLNAEGEVIRQFSSEADPDFVAFEGGPSAQPLLPVGYGLLRFNWDLHRDPINHVKDIFVLGDYSGGMVAPGNYTIRLIVDGKSYDQNALILPDPRVAANVNDYVEQEEVMLTIENTVAEIHGSVEMMIELKEQMTNINSRLTSMGSQPDLVEKGELIIGQIDEWTEKLVQPDQETFQDVINFQNRLNAELLNLHDRIGAHDPRITTGARERLSDLLEAWEELANARDDIIYVEMEDFNRLYSEKQLPALFLPTPEAVDSW